VSELVQFYLDEHIPSAVAEGVRHRGVDVMTLDEANMPGARDEEHLAFGREENCVLVTHDDDFLRLAAEGISHAGIVYIHP
jgi:predicted nuclease of predicted toxin-antitoxin system